MTSKTTRILRTVLVFAAVTAVTLAVGVGFQRLLNKIGHEAAPSARPVSAVAFEACGETVGVLLVRSDGSTTWHLKPFHGLLELTAEIADDRLIVVRGCPQQADPDRTAPSRIASRTR